MDARVKNKKKKTKKKVKQGEVTPGIPVAEYERRRRQLVESLPDGSLVVCVAGHVKFMSAGERHIPLPWAHLVYCAHTGASPQTPPKAIL